MTEADWNSSTDVAAMLAFLRGTGRLNERRLRLLACACVRHAAWDLLTDARCREAVEVRERHEDGKAGDAELKAAQMEAWRALADAVDAHSPAMDAFRAAVEAAGWPYPSFAMRYRVAEDRDAWFRDPDGMWARETRLWAERGLGLVARLPHQGWANGGKQTGEGEPEGSWQCFALRCLFGNPFRPVALDPSWLTWHDGVVVRLARAAYEERELPSGRLDPARLGVLADALADAGAVDGELLDGLRGPGPHYRGFWCLDVLLEKS